LNKPHGQWRRPLPVLFQKHSENAAKSGVKIR